MEEVTRTWFKIKNRAAVYLTFENWIRLRVVSARHIEWGGLFCVWQFACVSYVRPSNTKNQSGECFRDTSDQSTAGALNYRPTAIAQVERTPRVYRWFSGKRLSRKDDVDDTQWTERFSPLKQPGGRNSLITAAEVLSNYHTS